MSNTTDLKARLEAKLIGQPAAIDALIPILEMYGAGLSPAGRPVGVLLFLGPTGTGKTKTVEALAEVIHGSAKTMIKVNCAEYQHDHEIAKLIGAPPGYLGHGQTQPAFTGTKLKNATSEQNDLSIVVFDEIEKAAPALTQILLGVFDKATLTLGDNNVVGFDRSLIIMTSNLGGRAMQNEMKPSFGFEALLPKDANTANRLNRIGLRAVKKAFSPEFVNRIDSIITFSALSTESLAAILDLELSELQAHVDRRLGHRSFHVDVPARSKRALLKLGTSPEYGARELKRVIHRSVMRPLVSALNEGSIPPGSIVTVAVNETRTELRSKQGIKTKAA